MNASEFPVAYNPDSPAVVHFYDPVTGTLTYVLADVSKNEAVIIDPVLEYDLPSSKVGFGLADQVIDFIKKHNLKLLYILETHAHADHLTSAHYIKSKLGGTIAIGEGIKRVQSHFVPFFNLTNVSTDGSQFDHLFKEGEKFSIGSFEGYVLHTPGHTNDSNTFVIGDCAFVGDTVFAPDVGTARCDFPGGNAEVLYDSIQKIFALPSNTRIFLCHDYPPAGRNWMSHTTIAQQKEQNIHLKNDASKEQFVKFRTERDAKLSTPRLLLPSIQVNINAGKFQEPETNAKVYIKLPVSGL